MITFRREAWEEGHSHPPWPRTADLGAAWLCWVTCYWPWGPFMQFSSTTGIGSAAFPPRDSDKILPFKWLAESPKACWLRTREHTNAWSHPRLRHLFYQEIASGSQTEVGASSQLSLNFHLPLLRSALVVAGQKYFCCLHILRKRLWNAPGFHCTIRSVAPESKC